MKSQIQNREDIIIIIIIIIIMNMIELTDLMDGNNEAYAVVPVERVAATIREWYPADDAHVRPSDLEKVDELQAALLAEDYEAARELASELAVGFDHVQVVARNR